jgi:hypothetical protein
MKLYIAMSAFLILGSGVSYAADSAATSGATAGPVGTRHGACSADIQKFCADVEHGKGKIRECLKQHIADLVGPCKARMEEHAGKTKK